MTRITTFMAAVLVCGWGTGVHAQGGGNAQPDTMPAPSTDIKRPGTLSDKLGATDGVIRPTEDVDPGIGKDAPVAHPNSTPVIPPGNSGGATPK